MHRTNIIIAVGLALAVTLPAAPAEALNLQSFVSSHGSDSSTCTAAAPCLTFAHTITQTASGGEINVVDAGNYGPMTITKALSIVNDGAGTANIRLAGSGNGITISAGATDAVSLRGLTIDGGGIGTTGIQFNTGRSLTVVNCVIRRVTHNGINFVPNSASDFSISNSLVVNNGVHGIAIIPTGAFGVTAVLNRVGAHNNTQEGIFVDGELSSGTVRVSAYDSVAGNNGAVGFMVGTSAGAAATTLMLFHSVSANNYRGLYASGSGATLRVANSMVTGNTAGWIVLNGGVVQSYGNNAIDGNDGNEVAPPSAGLK